MTATDLAREPRARREPLNEAALGRPAAPLQALIASYTGYLQAGLEPAEHAGLPSPYMTLIFTLNEPLTIARHADPRQSGGSFVTLAGGLHTVPALVVHDGWQSGIQVMLNPLGARAILGLPAAELASIDVEGSEVFGALAGEVHERMREAADWSGRFAAVDEVLSARLHAHLADEKPGTSAELSFAWRRLLATSGTISVAELARQTGWSERHLRARFAGEFGLTPKAAARVIRFYLARRMLQGRAAAGGHLDLAGLAVSCGYYDQAHLDAEFRAMAGSPPTIWLAREFRNLQAGGPVPDQD